MAARLGDLAGFDPINLVKEQDHKDWVQPLQDQCLYYFVEHLSQYCDEVNGRLQLKPGLKFPPLFCEELMEYLRQAEPFIPSRLLHIFANTSQTQLRRMDLRHTLIDDATFADLMHHKPADLDLIGCENLTAQSLLELQKHGENLVAFSYSDFSYLFDDLVLPRDWNDFGFMYRQIMPKGEQTPMNILSNVGLRLPKLKRLCLQRIPPPRDQRDIYDRKSGAQKVIDWFLARHTELTNLDITGCKVFFPGWEEMGRMSKLTHLCLHDVSYGHIKDPVSIIKKLKELRVLDLSKCDTHQYQRPTEILTELVSELTHLTSLDISGTNLCGKEPPSGKCGIPGLEGRHFEYLGLINTESDRSIHFKPPRKACERKHLPATKVAGTANADQVLVALEAFCRQPCKTLLVCIEELNFFIYQSPEDMKDYKGCIQVVMRVLRYNLHHEKIAHEAVRFLARVVKLEQEHQVILPLGLKRDMLAALLSALATQSGEPWTTMSALDMLVNCDLPYDLSFIPRQTVRRMIPHSGNLYWDNNCNYSLFIISAMVSEMNMKEWAAKNNLMQEMLSHIIKITTTDWTYDVIMQKLWNIFWTLTDMCPSNGKLFLDLNGLDVFMTVYKFYKSQQQTDPDFRRENDDSTFCRMCGMMENIVEDDSLVPRLMRSDVLSALYDMLTYPETSKGACGTFAYLLKGGDAMWTVSSPLWADVARRVEEVINTWSIYEERSVNYKSFIPMVYLLDCNESPTSQYWAAWQLCSMVCKDPWHYGLMLKDEGGLERFEKIVHEGTSSPEVLKLAHEMVKGFEDAKEEAKRRESRCTIC